MNSVLTKIKQVSIYFICFILFCSVAFQGYHYIIFQKNMIKFTSQGPRFTAYDGQKLCKSVKASENVIRFLHPQSFIDLPELHCDYLNKK